MAQRSHVPKFGNWDSDNVPYTAYFENARREKGGMMMNPNDPMENPEAFDVDADEVKASSLDAHSHNETSLERGTRRRLPRRGRGSEGSFTPEFADETNNFDQKKRRSITKGGSSISSFSSSIHNRHKSTTTSSFNHLSNHEATPIPKFGAWDVTDPKSGEGYSAIFSKIKEERQTTPSQVSHTSTPPLNHCSNVKNQYHGPSFALSKVML
ncbi:RPM1-interacting protein 4-like [Abrus precatorius]|uniref:RPM1-interacting protein 4-like n=1 Tax=Abrus precatorius TaxID=3816 RepID=A0A8B8K3C1_ABRPR|nr:RPM1-interacting protein 4-like [Abrus precatorius]